MAIYDATVTRSKAGSGVRFDVDILYGGVDIVPGQPELSFVMTPTVAKANRQFTHTLDQYDHDETHLYAKVTLSFDGAPAWTIEIHCVPDDTTPSGHAFWAEKTLIDLGAPVTITEVDG